MTLVAAIYATVERNYCHVQGYGPHSKKVL